MVAESWFRSLWKSSKKYEFFSEKTQIGVLAFEAASLMSKLLQLWQSLTDRQVAKLREEISNSIGIKKLVSEDDDYTGSLICAELMENLVHVARSVARLSKKCNDPLLKSFEPAFGDLIKFGTDIYGWQFSWKKMDKKAKKMEQFIVTNGNLHHEMETLAELEQTLKRLRANDNSDSITLVEYEKKVVWKRQEVKRLKETSLWSRTYDYAIILLARSVFTIYGRIGHVFGINDVADVAVKDSRIKNVGNNRRNHSTVFMQSSVYPSDNYVPRFSANPAAKSVSVSGPLPRTGHHMVNSHSGPIGISPTVSNPTSGKYTDVGFHSGPMGKSTLKSSPISRASKGVFRMWQSRDTKEKIPRRKLNERTASGPLVREMICNDGSTLSNIYSNSKDVYSGVVNGIKDAGMQPHPQGLPLFASKNKLLNAPPETLGATGLALHYANVIIFIEKLAASPHLIGNDARDDLYNMLPASIRAALRAQLKPYSKSLMSSDYDTVLASEWNEAILRTLEWLAPLAHNMIRWQSERSFEHQNLVSRTNVLLVQTLHFANQEKTETEITELLVGLNYLWRFGREITAKSLTECASGRTLDEYVE